uniref:Methyltransferase domain-containing protein n=2 Tax=Kalmanozyma brasiliensis (strain GHG001) TaxID=1365824 RepID=V5EV34_KALBG
MDPSQLEHVRVVDLCTGSGCIALLVADALRTRLGTGGSWRVVACDQSPQAVELAQENAVKLSFTINEPDSNLHIVQADIFDDAAMDQLASLAGGPFDLILSNPPYIPRREWLSLPAEVKQHEDPAALIGERDATSPPDPSSNGRQDHLDRMGLTFHERLAHLLYRSSFSTSTPGLPRLVAEYGKAQHANVERLHIHLTPPKDRLPKIIKVSGQLVVIGVGNATTHPNTRHSIGQIVLDPLLTSLVEQDRSVRSRLREVRDVLEQGRLVHADRAGWDVPVPSHLPNLDLDAPPPPLPSSLLKVTGPSGGWTATLPLLIPSSPRFFSSRNPEDSTVYQVNVLLFKPAHAMNRSGVALKAFLASHGAEYSSDRPPSDDVLVLQDELDLPFGEAKRREGGSARGHNGVRDIIARLAIPVEPTKKGQEGPKLSRVRIGIGRPTGKGTRVDRWVLSPLTEEEMHSCKTEAEGTVLSQVQRHTLEWVRERCTTLTREMGADVEKHDRVSSRKDQFGVLRTVWVS